MKPFNYKTLALLAIGIAGAGQSQAAITGFEAGLSGNATGSSWKLNTGDCCGGPYASSTASSLTLGGGNYAWGSAFNLNTQTVGTSWTSTFTVAQSSNSGYYAFVIQNDTRGAAALDRDNGGYAGNGSDITPSVFLGFRSDGKAGFTMGGAGSVFPSELSEFGTTTGLNYANSLTVNLAYNGSALSGSAFDGTNTFNFAPMNVNLSTALGASTAYVGFSSGAGGFTEVTFSDFAFTPSGVPEPSTGALALGSLGTLLLLRRRNAR